MTKKEDIMKKNIVMNMIFYNKMKQVKDKFILLHPQKRMKEFDNNYWKLVYILQYKLFNEKKSHYKILVYSKYGAELHYNNLHRICGFQKTVFVQLMDFFDKQNVVKALRSENGGRSYSPGGGNYSSRATIYYIPLQLVLEMEKCDTNVGFTGECIEVTTNKNNLFFKKKEKKVEEQIEEKINIYGDDRKFITDWERIDMMRIENICYDEQMFLELAKTNHIYDPEGELQRCIESGKIGSVKLNHGRVFRYGWNRLKKCLRPSVLYEGEHVEQGFDFHCADFKMMAVLAWILKDKYNLKEKELDDFTNDVKGDFYQTFIEWAKIKYKIVLKREVVKESLLRFRNSTNASKRFKEEFMFERQFFEEKYPNLTKSLLYNYKEIQDKNCISVHCQNVEGYIVHELILPRLEGVVSKPFSMCDAIWIKESDINKANKVEKIALDQYDWLIKSLKYDSVYFEDQEEKKIFEQLKNILAA